jgi:hypothetical protein
MQADEYLRATSFSRKPVNVSPSIKPGEQPKIVSKVSGQISYKGKDQTVYFEILSRCLEKDNKFTRVVAKRSIYEFNDL